MRKLLTMKTIILLASVATAAIEEPRTRIENDIFFYVNKESAVIKSFFVTYPNSPRQVIVDGRIKHDNSNGDCLALIKDGNIPTEQIQKFADSIEVLSTTETNQGLPREVKSQVINGTVVFKLTNVWLFMANIDIRTKNQESFHSNLRNTFGETAENMSLSFYYSQNCRDLVK